MAQAAKAATPTKSAKTTVKTAAKTVKAKALKREKNVMIGKRLRELRDQRGLTQEGLAKLIAARRDEGCSRAAVGQWEIHTTHPHYDMIETIAEVLDVSPAYLAFGINGPEDQARHDARYSDLSFLGEMRFGDSPDKMEQVRQWGIPTDLIATSAEGEPEDLIVLEVKSSTLRPEYMPGDRVYVDTSDKKPTGGAFVFWDGIGPAFGHMNVIPSKSGPMVKVTGEGVDLDPIPLDDLEIIGKIKGRMTLS
jgi:transcriptional regulator with XRE-family HTH domain